MRSPAVVMCLLLTACTRPSITSFSARPESFCAIPQRITLQWQAAGQTIRLESRPTSAPGSEIVEPSGSRERTVDTEATTFTLTAISGSASTDRRATVSRLTGTRTYALGGIARCQGGRLVRQVEVLEDRYASSVVVGRLRNRDTVAILVEGPGGRSAMIEPLGFSDMFIGSALVGTWTMVKTVIPACDPTASVGGGVAVEADVGCP